MDIKLKLKLNFVASLNKLKDKYGEKFEYLNGFHNSQLNFNDFIDNFVDSTNVVDVSNDQSANNSTKDIRTLMSDMMKPHSKLLAFNKIYYEITKRYGNKIADEWLENEWSGASYLHDASSSTFMPYCYKGEETLTINYRGEILNISFSNLYNLVIEEEEFDITINDMVKFPENLFVLDIVNEKEIWTKVTRILKHSNTKPMRFIKYANGLSQIVTEDHPIITLNGDIPAKEISMEDEVFTIQPNFFEERIKEDYFTKEIGWLTGMFLAEGSAQKCQVSLRQNEGPQREKILYILNKYNLPYSIDKDEKIRLKASKVERYLESILIGKTAAFKQLPSDYIYYPNDFLDGIVAGLIDGDGTIDGYKNRHCQIRIASELLCHQISNYLQSKDIFCGDRIPYLYQSENSFTQKLPLFGIGFPLTKEDYFSSIDCIKIVEKYQSLQRKGNFKNKRYQNKYNWVNIIENTEYIDNCPIVYDITTGTGHFICNGVVSHNCYAYDLDKIVERGLFFIEKFKTDPPQHLTTFNDHVLEFVSWASNRSAGAVGLPSYLVYSYYFWYKDTNNNFYLKDPEYYRRQCFQKFVYDLNQPYLRIVECAFTNISIMDRNYLIELFGTRKFPNGDLVLEHIEGIIEHQKIFMEVVSEIRQRTMMSFPVLTYSLLYQNDEFVDQEFARWANRHNMEWCDSNFYVGNDVTSLSNCCRLISNTSKLNAFINSIGGTSLSVGSIKVNTINLRRIALESDKDEEKYIKILDKRVDITVKALDAIRVIIKRNVEKGLLPNYTYGLIEMDKQYNTLGITAMYETLNDFGYIDTDEFGNKSYSEKAFAFSKRILDRINTLKDSYKFDYSINVECIPAERANVVLCNKDNEIYQDNQYFIYSNQWIPLIEKCTVDEKIKLGAVLDKECGGGQISHINLEGKFTDEEQSWKLLNHIAKSGVIYFAYNLKISVCKNGHGFFGDTCPICQESVFDTFQRIVGYLSPSRSYSKERFKEFDLRKWFTLNEG